MYLLSFNDIFAANIIRALCWTLVHSLWAGLLLVMVTGVIMLLTKKSSAALRYNLLTGAFISFIIVMLTVFVMQIMMAAPAIDRSHSAVASTVSATTDTALHLYFIPDKVSVASTINDFLNRYANAIVLIWFLIIVFRSIRFAGGISKVHQLKHTQLSAVGAHWDETLAGLSQRLGIRRSIRFFQSGIATIPMVAGHFKPVILFPIGLITSLPQNEIEAILIHELAHIKRRDFLMNILQHLAEILFFFNPAILWVSSLIKIERENCCDDIAVANTGNKRNYINALVSFQEYHLGNMQYAPALADTKKHLLQRVKRMLYNKTGSLNKWEKTSLAVCLVAVAMMAVFFTNGGTASKNNPTHLASLTGSIKMPQAEQDKYNTPAASSLKDTGDIKMLMQEQQKAELAKAKYDADRKVADSNINQISIKKPGVVSASAQADIDAAHAAQKKAQDNMQSKDQQRTKREIEWRKTEDGKPVIVSKLSYSVNNNVNAAIQAAPVQPYNTYRPVAGGNNQSQPQAVNSHTITGIQYNSDSPTKETDIEQLTKNFINDLSSAKVITGTTGLSYRMSAESLIVNGVVQSDAIHKKLKEKYIQSDDWKLLYNWKESR